MIAGLPYTALREAIMTHPVGRARRFILASAYNTRSITSNQTKL